MTYPIGGAAMAVLLEIDPNVVKPGWTPLLITVGLALVMVLLFRSMKRQFRRVHTNFPERTAGGDRPEGDDADGPDATPADDAAGPGEEHVSRR